MLLQTYVCIVAKTCFMPKQLLHSRGASSRDQLKRAYAQVQLTFFLEGSMSVTRGLAAVHALRIAWQQQLGLSPVLPNMHTLLVLIGRDLQRIASSATANSAA